MAKRERRGGKRPGAGRPPAKVSTQYVGVRVPVSIVDAIQMEAQEAESDFSAAVNARLRRGKKRVR